MSDSYPLYIVRDAVGRVLATDGALDDVLKEFADKAGGTVWDHNGIQVYPEVPA